jgi:small subunit ribosomal protein S14
MAKKSMIRREKKRQEISKKYTSIRNSIKLNIKEAVTFEEKLNYNFQIQKLPRDSSAVRLHNRCLVTGRPRGYYRFFGLSRNVLREMAHSGLLPGVTKSSW